MRLSNVTILKIIAIFSLTGADPGNSKENSVSSKPILQFCLSSGGATTLLILPDGKLLQTGSTTNNLPVYVADSIKSASSGTGKNMLLRKDGSVWTWVGEPKKIDSINIPHCQSVSGGYNCLALDSSGVVWDWDRLPSPAFDGSTHDWSIPSPVCSSVVSISAGFFHDLFIKCDGTLWGWGGSVSCEFGLDNRWAVVPVKIPLGGNTSLKVIKASAGRNQSIYMKSDGSVWTSRGCNTDTLVLSDSITDIASGMNSFFALKENGDLYGWGSNGMGELGIGSNQTQVTMPTKILDSVIAVSGGHAHTTVIRYNGDVWTWGWNIAGVIGRGDTISSKIPVQMLDPSGEKVMNVLTFECADTGAIPIRVYDQDVPDSLITVTTASEQKSILPDSCIRVNGAGSAREITISTPLINADSAQVPVTINVSNGYQAVSNKIIIGLRKARASSSAKRLKANTIWKMTCDQTGRIRIRFNNSGPYIVKLFNSQGGMQGKWRGNVQQNGAVNIQAKLPAGAYYLTVKQNDKTQSVKTVLCVK